VADRVTELFAEYADAYARGDRPQAHDFLARAGGDADALADLIDGFLARAPTRVATANTAALLEAFLANEPPLVALRAIRGVRVDEVVEALVRQLGLDPAKRAKVKRYYQRLEQGLLDAARVSDRVWDVIVPHVPGARELSGRRGVFAAASAYYRLAETAPNVPLAAQSEGLHEPDEIDHLFGVA